MILLILALVLSASSVSAESNASSQGPVTQIQISGTINPGSAEYIRSSLQKSEKLQAQALILVLNTPGGLLSSTREIVQMFSQSSVPVVIFVSPGGSSATSAGAVLGLAAHLVAMAPGTNIGAAHPVGTGGEDVKSTMGEKVTNDTAALVRSQSALRGHNVDLAEKIVTQSLSFSAEEAKEKNLVNFVAADLDALLLQLDQKKVFVEAKRGESLLSTTGLTSKELVFLPMTWSQKFLHFIADPNISTTLLAMAGMAFYVEVASGFSLLAPGVIGLLLAVVGGVSLSMLPINLGGLLLLGMGLVFFIAEIFVTSFGLLFVAGLISMCLGALFLIDPNEATLRVSYAVLVPLLLAFAIVGGIIAWLMKNERPLNHSKGDSMVGNEARVEVLDDNRRSGTVRVLGELWSFTSDEDLSLSENVEIIARNNLQLKVKRRT
jgi:membrane-bound serine protease (ClpP class)